MRVAVLTRYFPTSVEPWIGHSAYQTLRILARQCDLHVFKAEAHYPAFLTPPSARRPPLDPAWNPPGVSATYIPYRVLPVVSRPFNGRMMARALLPHVRAFAPDILLNYIIYPDGFATVQIARELNLPAVLTAIGSDLNRIPGGRNGPVRRQTIEALGEADLTTTVSADLRKTAIKLGAPPNRTVAILNGCDTSIFHPASRANARAALDLPSQQRIILYVGRLDLRKGLIELIEAAAQLRSTHPDAHTYLIGDGPDRPALLAAIARLSLAGSVTFVPSCLTAKVAQWMAASDLVTLPSYLEGCPNVVLEALSAGRPVVATNVGGIPELMDDSCGQLITPRDPSGLAKALAEVLSRHWDADAISVRHSRSWTGVAQDLHTHLTQTLTTFRSTKNCHPERSPA